MKKSALILVALGFLLFPSFTFATSGACSSHGGVNCSVGAINAKAVCSDGWLSSVDYANMKECMGYSAKCTVYLNEPQYSKNKTTIKGQLNDLGAKMIELQNTYTSLGIERKKIILQGPESGRGITTAGWQSQVNSINRDYDKKELDVEAAYNGYKSQYNSLVAQYDSICRSYTYAERNNICLQNFGNNYKLMSNNNCIEEVPVAQTQFAPPVPATSQSIVAPVVQQVITQPPAQSKQEVTRKTPIVSTTSEVLAPTGQIQSPTPNTTSKPSVFKRFFRWFGNFF